MTDFIKSIYLRLYKMLGKLFGRLPISYKLALSITLLITLSMSLLGIVMIANQTSLMREQIINHGTAMIIQLADVSKDSILADDKLSMYSMITNIAGTTNNGVYGVAIFDENGRTLSITGLVPKFNEIRSENSGAAVYIDTFEWLSKEEDAHSELISFISSVSVQNLTAGYVVLTLSRSHITESIESFINAFITATVILIMLIIVAAFVMSKRLSKPIDSLIDATIAIGEGDYQYRISESRGDEIGTLITGFNDMAQGLQQKHKLESAFSRYVSVDVASEALENLDHIELGGKSTEASVLFADIVGFTQLSENMSAEDVADLLNEYFTYISRICEHCYGSIDKFMGDCAMLVFGVLKKDPDHRFHALACATIIQKLTRQLNRKRASKGLPLIHLRIGMNSGTMLAGNLGSEERLHFTVIGDSVNLAARLADQAQAGEILISDTCYRHQDINSRIFATPYQAFKLRGKQLPVQTYKVIALADAYSNFTKHGIERALAPNA